jgi:hypothetical protein
MVKKLSLCLALVIAILFSVPAFAQDPRSQSLTLGYGFAVFNEPGKIGRVEGGYYDFIQLSYIHEKPFTERLAFLVEPFAAYVNRPDSGVEGGVILSGKYYFREKKHNGFYLTVGAGAAYTSINFEEQGTHGLFILQGGVGYKWKEFFIEDRLRHYSNAGTADPNRSVNSNIIVVGMDF